MITLDDKFLLTRVGILQGVVPVPMWIHCARTVVEREIVLTPWPRSVSAVWRAERGNVEGIATVVSALWPASESSNSKSMWKLAPNPNSRSFKLSDHHLYGEHVFPEERKNKRARWSLVYSSWCAAWTLTSMSYISLASAISCCVSSKGVYAQEF